ncbi:MAG: putative transport system permease protein [Nocardioidaceae bacterium]|nr:putative transport system permease protein [Nocardioidaceae bacterium]
MLTEGLAELVPPGVQRYFRAPIRSTTVSVSRVPGTVSSPTSRLVWREGMCGHLQFRSGRCPTRAGEVAVSVADTRNYGWRTGSAVTMEERVGDPAAVKAHPAPRARLRVVGVYTVVPGDYWYGAGPTGQSGTAAQNTRQPLIDDWLTPRSTLAGTAAVGWLDPAEEVDLRLNRAVVARSSASDLRCRGSASGPHHPRTRWGR